MSATDSLIMSNSLQTPNIDLPFVSKRIVSIADLNSGNYSTSSVQLFTKITNIHTKSTLYSVRIAYIWQLLYYILQFI